MALNINGTTGISGVDGSASAASIAGTDANTGLSFASDTVNINTGGSTRVTVDSAGSVGIGTSTPTSSFSNADDLVVGDGSGNRGMTILAGTSGISGIEFSDGTGSDATKTAGGIRYYHSSDYMRFNTGGGTERMRLRTSTGGLMIGADGTNRIGEPNLHVQNSGASSNVASFYFSSSQDRDAIIIRHDGSSGGTGRTMINFANSSGNGVGNIRADGSNTVYNTSSDYRLKENEVLISDGITRLKQLKPYRFNFKITPSITQDGFFAHEAKAVVPQAVTGEKDETENVLYKDDDSIPEGKIIGDVKETIPKYQGIDHSKLVPLLTAALQEAVAKIEVLETKVAALEAG